ncbi:hypothetical protein [Paraburkholderia sp. SIMBA_054]|uniref:hypothetical protein n=1 Tax=Paraburkholderia sp. SIMBA_054 TaxID=3085795 RepID=UPI00397CF602
MAAPAGATSCITFGVTVSETGMPVAAQRETTPRPQAGPQEQGEEPQKGFKAMLIKSTVHDCHAL